MSSGKSEAGTLTRWIIWSCSHLFGQKKWQSITFKQDDQLLLQFQRSRSSCRGESKEQGRAGGTIFSSWWWCCLWGLEHVMMMMVRLLMIWTRNDADDAGSNCVGQVQRTVTTLMGGRGYIQWRATHLERDRKASSIQQVFLMSSFHQTLQSILHLIVSDQQQWRLPCDLGPQDLNLD